MRSPPPFVFDAPTNNASSPQLQKEEVDATPERAELLQSLLKAIREASDAIAASRWDERVSLDETYKWSERLRMTNSQAAKNERASSEGES